MSTRDAIRIIDANLNRAREALRVMEEFARFSLEDGNLSASLKNTRHALAACIPNSLERARMANRDIRNDVGTTIDAPGERDRADLPEVLRAACKRLTESLRALEEYGKTVDSSFAAVIESLRYDAYELERRLLRTCEAREQFGGARIYVIITESLCAGDWFKTAEDALRGGADVLQLREKDLPDRELLRRATQLAALCRDHDALFILNDRPDLAALSGANGVHLGQDDVSVREARRILPSTAIVGVSTHTPEQLAAAVEEAPGYIAVGPIFATDTKPSDRVVGVTALEAARRYTALPLVAIGGIDSEKASEVLSIGSCCLCVCTAVIARPDAQAAAARLRALVDHPPNHEAAR